MAVRAVRDDRRCLDDRGLMARPGRHALLDQVVERHRLSRATATATYVRVVGGHRDTRPPTGRRCRDGRVSTGPLPDERTDQLLFAGPTRGGWLLRIHALPSSGMPASYHWLLEVPPRPMPSDGHIDATPPDLIAAGGAVSVVAELGSACYVQTCADRTIEPTILRPGIALTGDAELDLTLSDESGMTAWVVVIRPPGD